MAKYYGEIGYAMSVEKRPGVWVNDIVRKKYTGDANRVSRYLETPEKVNDDIRVGVELSIVADAMAYQHFSTIRYATYMGEKWKVTSVEVQHPRLKLVLGGLYHDGDE